MLGSRKCASNYVVSLAINVNINMRVLYTVITVKDSYGYYLDYLDTLKTDLTPLEQLEIPLESPGSGTYAFHTFY